MERDLEALGIEPAYDDYKGDRTRVPEATLEAIAGAMEARADRHAGSRRPRIVRFGESLSLPEGSSLRLEDGSLIDDGDLDSGPPLGYHEILGDGTVERVIVTPGRCFLPAGMRVWGWALQLYALRSRRSWGIGDIADLARFGRWATQRGASVALINPLHAAAPTIPQEPSPYFPGSRCFRNPLYLAIEDVPGASELPELDALAVAGRALNDDRRIDRDEIYRVKMKALEGLWRGFRGDRRFDAYRARSGPTLEGFATWMALAERNAGPWPEWPGDYRHPRAAGIETFVRDNRDRVDLHQWVQWLLDDQLLQASSAIGIVNDLAIGVEPHGADAWLWQDELATGSSVGAPPDDYTTEGQHWGVLGFDPRALQAAGYEPFVQVLRAAMRHAAGLRFDHVMGLWRLYWIPEGIAPRDGGYVRYPADDLLDILALESHRSQAFVVGEDLGTVEPVVREEMLKRDMLSYKLLWFQEGTPQDYPELSLAAANNHDLPTTAGLWTGEDARVAQEMGFDPMEDFRAAIFARLERNAAITREMPVSEVVDRSYRALSHSPSAVVLGALEDALEVTERHNQPGTTGEGNWSTALPVPLEEIESHERGGELSKILDEGRGGAGA
ncbi:MAG: 4-alpha-glucanotransferase [Actinomycetota bacterium]